MACNAEILKSVQMFSLLDDEELAVVAGQVEFWKVFVGQRS